MTFDRSPSIAHRLESLSHLRNGGVARFRIVLQAMAHTMSQCGGSSRATEIGQNLRPTDGFGNDRGDHLDHRRAVTTWMAKAQELIEHHCQAVDVALYPYSV